MRFTYIRLVLYKRFPLRDLEVFEHQFTSKLLMITGPNGSGKSSLFNELTHLPADKNDFYKGGYKEIRCDHEGKEYKLISDFRDGVSYHFIVDDEELNLSNNITTQRELVFKHFKITQTVHDLLIGKENFTDMSLINRKKLFSAITHINIDKVLENYNELKEELKNNDLLLRTNTSLLQSEEQKLINQDHLERLRDTHSRTKEFIDFLLDFRTGLGKYHFNSDLDKAYGVYTNWLSKLKKLIDQYYIPITAFPIGHLENYKTQYTTSLNMVNYQLKECYTELETKQQEITVLGLTNQTNTQTLETRKQEILENIRVLTNSLSFFKDPDVNTENIKSDIYKLEAVIPDVVRTIPLNLNRQFSKDRYDQLLNKKKEALDNLTHLTTKEISLSKEIDHLSQHNDNVICPNCDHIWSLKDNATTVKNLKRELSETLAKKIQSQDLIKHTDKQVEELIEYFNLYRQYSTVRNATNVYMKSFWEVVDSGELIFKNPTEIAVQLRNATNELLNIETIRQFQRELQEIDKNLNILSSLKNTNVQQLEANISELMDFVTEKQLEKISLTETLTTISKVDSLYKYIRSIENAIEEAQSDVRVTNTSYVMEDLLRVIESDLSKYKVIMIETEKELHQYNSIQYTIDRYKKVIDDVQSNIKVLTIVLDELSPKNGLIAKSISSFLNIIIGNINSTIGGIWEYKMILKAIDVETEALNYRFKVEVEDKLPIDDISKVSNGMKEVINLSFKMILYKLLGLENYPVYLDEFGVKLDKVHRSKIFDLIFKMIGSTQYSQIFLITHLDMSYAMFKDVEQLEL